MNQSKELKLPSLDQYRKPIQLNPSYRLKYQNPLRVRFIRFLKNTDRNETDTFYLENFAKANNIPIECTYRSIVHKPKEEKKVVRYKKPNLQYFKEEDTEVDQNLVRKILHLPQQRSQVFISL